MNRYAQNRDPQVAKALWNLRMAAGHMEAQRRNYEEARAGQRSPRGSSWCFLSKWGAKPHLYKMFPFSAVLDENGKVEPVGIAELKMRWVGAIKQFRDVQEEVAPMFAEVRSRRGGRPA